MPVACQSRDPARSAERANPRWSAKRIPAGAPKESPAGAPKEGELLRRISGFALAFRGKICYYFIEKRSSPRESKPLRNS